MRRARESWSQGVLLSGTVLDWGDAYTGVSSQVQLGAPNSSRVRLGAATPSAGLFVRRVRESWSQGVLLSGTVLDWGDAYAGVSRPSTTRRSQLQPSTTRRSQPQPSTTWRSQLQPSATWRGHAACGAFCVVGEAVVVSGGAAFGDCAGLGRRLCRRLQPSTTRRLYYDTRLDCIGQSGVPSHASTARGRQGRNAWRLVYGTVRSKLDLTFFQTS